MANNDLVPFSFKTLAAIPGKSKNDVYYSKQVLLDSVPKWLGRPFIMDHDTYSSEKVYGILNKATYGVDVVSNGQTKEGLWLSGVGKMPNSLFRRIKASKNIPSLISHVSIGGTGEGIFEPTQITLMSFEPQELSITAFPGIPDAEIVSIDMIRESYLQSSKGDMEMSDKIVVVPMEQAEAEAAKAKRTTLNNASTTVTASAPITLTVPANASTTSVVAAESGQVKIREQEDEDDAAPGVCPKCGNALGADGSCPNCGWSQDDASAKPAKTKEQEDEGEGEDEGEDEAETGTPGPLAGSGSQVGNKPSGVIAPKIPSGSVKGAGEHAPQLQKVTLAPTPIPPNEPKTPTAAATQTPAQVPLKTQTSAAVGSIPFDLSSATSNLNQRVKELYTKYLNETHDTREAMKRAWIAAQAEILEPGYATQV